MRMSLEHERLVRMLKESISLMCKSSLNYNLELSVEGLLGITLDKKDIFLVNINESFKSDKPPEPEESEEEVRTPQKRSQSDIIEIKGEDQGQSSCAKRRRRRRSRNGSSVDGGGATADYELPGFSAGSPDNNSSASASQHSSARAETSQNQRDVADTSRDRVQMPGAIDSSEDAADFDSFVIKQEVGEEGEEEMGEFGFNPDDSYEGHSGMMPMGGPGQGPYPGGIDPGEGGSQHGHYKDWQFVSSVPQSRYRQVRRTITQPSQVPAKAFQCSFCTKTFSTAQGKSGHEKFHTGKALTCESCQRLCISRAELLRHVKSVHDSTKFQCDICNKTFSWLSSLNRHKSHDH